MYSPEKPQQRIEEYPAFLIGKHPKNDTYLASYGQQFVMLAAPPGTGKGVGEVVPNALTYPDSMVINDPKFENWELTSGFRSFAGHKVFRFSPERLETHRWNPLTQISRDPLYRLGEIRTLASVLFVSSNEKNQEWYTKAGNVFTAILLYLMETPSMPFTLPQAYEVASLGSAMGAWAEQELNARRTGPHALSAETQRELNGVFEASKNKSSGWSTTADIVRDVLSIYAEKTVAWALSPSGSEEQIDFAKARQEKTTIYFSMSEESLKKFGPLMNLFFTQAIRQNSKPLPEHGGHCPDGTLRYKYQLALLMDEFAIMGRMEIMETAPALTRGAGLRYFIIFQGKDQIRAVYGTEKGNAIMKAFHIEIVFAPGDIELAKEYSARLGNRTVKVKTQSMNKRDRNQTDNYSDQGTPLMHPQDINELPYFEQLVFVQGTKTTAPMKIKARKIFYYEDETLNERSKMKPPPLPLGDAEKIATLTVPVRMTENRSAVREPHAGQMVNEHMQRQPPSNVSPIRAWNPNPGATPADVKSPPQDV